ncbi:MAG: glyoxalase [Anaerosporomusa subterranea]|nr:glyoxalase [Anaerosporomusa subterranea]
MAYQKKSYLEHAAIHVKDIHWHVRFFQEALGMSIRKIDGPVEQPKQVWMFGGPQLVSDPGFTTPEGRMAHLGSQMPQGRNWITLPDGLCIELMQATGESVAQVLAVDPRA